MQRGSSTPVEGGGSHQSLTTALLSLSLPTPSLGTVHPTPHAPLTPSQNGHTYDFIAAGDSLLNANDNNLEVRFLETPIALDRATGCTIIPGTVDYALARQSAEPARANLQQTVYESIPDGTVNTLNGVTIATLVCAAITLALTLLHSLRAHAPVAAHSKAVAGSV